MRKAASQPISPAAHLPSIVTMRLTTGLIYPVILASLSLSLPREKVHADDSTLTMMWWNVYIIIYVPLFITLKQDTN